MKIRAMPGHLIVQHVTLNGVAGCDADMDGARPLFAKVVDIGDSSSGDNDAIEGAYWTGGLVVLRKYTGTQVLLDGVPYVVVRRDEVIATIVAESSIA